MASGARSTAAWDLTALLNAADPAAAAPARHLWFVRLMEWLTHAAPRRAVASADGTPPVTRKAGAAAAPPIRLRHLLNVLEQHPDHRLAVQAMARRFVREIDAAALFADFGFSHRMALRSELWVRLRAQWLPGSPATRDLAILFPLLFDGDDAAWLEALDDGLLRRIAALLFAPEEAALWRQALLDALAILVSAVQAAGFSSPLRQRMSPALLAAKPFHQLGAAAERLRAAVGDATPGPDDADAPPADDSAALQRATYLRALLDHCRRAADSIGEHLEEHGVSVDIVFEADQLRERTARIEQIVECLLAPAPARPMQRLVATLARVAGERRGVRSLLARHYSQLARQVAERSAETGVRYITRSAAEYRDMLRRAAGGGLVLAGTTFSKFALLALGLSPFWSGFSAGVNYAASFIAIQLMHWTVATKQPAMTAPAMAAKLAAIPRDDPQAAGQPAGSDVEAVEAFVDEVAQLIRSQAAGIFGNLAMCAPLVLGVQWLARLSWGAPLVGPATGRHVVDTLSLLGPTPLYAAFTGVLLFGSSLIAGWVENWFVFHRLDGAIAWNPRIVARLGAARAGRWAAWWRTNVSGLAAAVSLGLLLGLVPVVGTFFGLPIEVRHVTLSTGQLTAALGAEGFGLLREPVFWWCVAGIAATGLLNVSVSFWLAFKVALRSRGTLLGERRRIYAAIRWRLLRQPFSFLVPPRP